MMHLYASVSSFRYDLITPLFSVFFYFWMLLDTEHFTILLSQFSSAPFVVFSFALVEILNNFVTNFNIFKK